MYIIIIVIIITQVKSFDHVQHEMSKMIHLQQILIRMMTGPK